MLAREPLEAARSYPRQRHTHHPVVVGIPAPADEAAGLGAIDQLDHAVVAQQELRREVAHRRIAGSGAAADGQEQLVLRGGEPGFGGSLVGPAEVAPQAGAEHQEALVVVVGKRPLDLHGNIVTR